MNSIVPFGYNWIRPREQRSIFPPLWASMMTAPDRLVDQMLRSIHEDFHVEDTPQNTDHTIVLHVGDDVTPGDISIRVSEDKTAVTITVDSINDDTHHERHLSYTYRTSDHTYDTEQMTAELDDGDLIVFLPYVEPVVEEKAVETPQRVAIPIRVGDDGTNTAPMDESSDDNDSAPMDAPEDAQ